MISQLPRWVEYGAFVLALIAGCVNAIGLIGFQHQSISHLSGTATLIGTEMMAGSFEASAHLLGVVLSFLIGAAVSGAVLSANSLKLGRHYDWLLVIEALLLFVSIYFLGDGLSFGHYTASAACGLQNALATTYSGAIVRTTHVTGIVTDLGIMIGAWFRGKALDRRKSILFLLIVSGFILGGAAGASLYGALGFMALSIPASLCLVLALSYRVMVRGK